MNHTLATGPYDPYTRDRVSLCGLSYKRTLPTADTITSTKPVTCLFCASKR